MHRAVLIDTTTQLMPVFCSIDQSLINVVLPLLTSFHPQPQMEKNDDDYNSDAWDQEIEEREEKRRRGNQINSALLSAVITACADDKDSDKLPTSKSNTNTTQSGDSNDTKAHSKQMRSLRVRNEEGSVVKMTVTLSPWYISYISHPFLNDASFLKTF